MISIIFAKEQRAAHIKKKKITIYTVLYTFFPNLFSNNMKKAQKTVPVAYGSLLC